MAPVALEYEQTERTLFFGITTSLDRQYSNAHQFYAVDNTVIAKYEIASGRQVDRPEQRAGPAPEQLPGPSSKDPVQPEPPPQPQPRTGC